LHLFKVSHSAIIFTCFLFIDVLLLILLNMMEYLGSINEIWE
jgi:hypothetical protein